MTGSELKSLPTFGFLTVCEHAPHGLFGGYLVLDVHGRPLEFHCTSPVKPNRAQEILYGPTLKPYVYGERIGQILVSKARSQPKIVCTDVEPAVCVEDFVTPRVVWLPGENEVAHPRSKYTWFQVESHRLAVRSTTAHLIASMRDDLSRFLENADLYEPFSRIREALDEARSATKAA